MTHKLLLCDDELHILRAAEFKFKRAGFEVRCAGDGQEGWELIQEEMPDLVLTDYQMPRLDGIELVQRIRGTPKTAHLPVIMLTAKGFELKDEHLRDELNIAKILAKPFSPRELLAHVSQLLEHDRAAAEQLAGA